MRGLVLQHVDQIEPDRLTHRNLDRMVVVEAGHPIPSHDAVPAHSVIREPGEDQGDLGSR